MNRTAILATLAVVLLGCDAGEPPRFVPAGPGAAVSPKESPGHAAPLVTPPKNIATH